PSRRAELGQRSLTGAHPGFDTLNPTMRNTVSIGDERMNVYCGLGALLTLGLAPMIAAPSAAQEQKDTLVFAVESLSAQTLDPILEARPGNATYQAAMYDSLVGFDLVQGGVGPGVAERWILSADGLAWTFNLRPAQKF